MRRLLLLLLLGCCSLLYHPAKADGNVGCLFSETLCTDKVEWCYDDYAFGKCLQIYGNVEEEDLARHELTTEELRAFERELQRLLLLGYRWSHAYTQCILQAMLYATKNRLHYDQKVCDKLIDQDLTAALGAFEAGDQVDPESVAIVRFTPNSEVENSNFADEVYYPPNDGDYYANFQALQESEPESANYETEYETQWPQHVKKSYRKMDRRSLSQDYQLFSRIYNTPGSFRQGYEKADINFDENKGQKGRHASERPLNYDEMLDAINARLENYGSRQIQSGPNEFQEPYMETPDPYYALNAALMNDNSLKPDRFNQYYNTPDGFRRGFEKRDVVDSSRRFNYDYESDPSSVNEEIANLQGNVNEEGYDMNDLMTMWLNSLKTMQPDELQEALKALDGESDTSPYYMSTSEFLTSLKPDRFNQHYNTPDRFRQGYESKDGVMDSKSDEDIPEPRIYIEEDDQDHYKEENGSGENDERLEALKELKYLSDNNEEYLPYEPINKEALEAQDEDDRQTAMLARLLNRWKSSEEFGQESRPKGGVYTEGGLIYAGDSNPTNEPSEGAPRLLTPELGALLADYEWGFRRRERLDVKKPGPPFDVKNQHFNHDSDLNHTQNIHAPLVKKELHDENEHPGKIHDSYDVDSSYAYVGFKESIRTWKEGERVVKTIADLLELEPSAFSSPRVGRNEVTFRVEPNAKSYNASEVAKRIDDIKEQLKDHLGVEVTSAGVGDKAKLPAVLKLAPEPMWSMPGFGERGSLQLLLVLAGLAAVVCSAGVLFVAHKIYRRRSKLADLNTNDTDPSQDYEDLFRDRKAGKSQSSSSEKHGDKQEPTGQRITSLSRESDNNSPSTRSSTSSWSEEPALTNMDISTGHMVLTYMEDHLKNKDRLEQEWQALCAYEAEPNATTASEKPENVPKNRKPGVLPYDHSRLVLNELTNLNSSDYINASTITDHDPRNPAYIAAQGPLPHTAPDFWQMVWEQGSVVMVMLTRLTENGTAMCHRYWPEEGSDLYHIYEVHLVSEHIWCDDYLVRSFYLKNLKTGETRTVTQFHFLSWPDRGIPSSTKALLEFRRKVNKSYRGRSCPIVVHCSDGASRTGTYCLIDMVLNRMAKGAKEIDIAATLEHIRDQRPHMVTTKQQFEFVLMAVAEEVHAILKALPAQLQQQHEKREKELAEKEKQEKQEK